MGEITKAFKDLAAYREAYSAKEQKEIREANEARDNFIESRESIKESRIARIERYSKFRSDVKDLLLAEAMNYVCEGACINDDFSRSVTENTIISYIRENGGADSIIHKATVKTYVLESLKNLINEYHTIIMEKVDRENPDTYCVDKEDTKEFLDKLANEEDIENIKQAIAVRVSNAEEEFMINNIADKQDMKEILDNTEDRIKAAIADDATSDDTKEDIKTEATRLGKVKIADVRNRRPRTVMEEMVRSLSRSAITDDVLKESFLDESAHLDMEKVVTSVRCMYTVLEAVNTLRLERVDEAYIKKTLNI